MKKTYIIPVLDTIEDINSQIMAGSFNVGDNPITSGEITDPSEIASKFASEDFSIDNNITE